VSQIIQNAQSQQNEDNSTLFGEHGQKIVNMGLQQSRSDDQITPTERNRAGKIPDQVDILI